MADITCYDSNGNILEHLTQWDIGQELKVRGADTSFAPTFHFYNRKSKHALVVPSELAGGIITTKVPNILLQDGITIIACMYYSDNNSCGRTNYIIRIPVIPRPRPADYEYIENIEHVDWITLSEKAKALLDKLENISFRTSESYIQFTTDGVIWENLTDLESIRGSDGITPSFSIGEVKTLPAGSQATVTMKGALENLTLNFGIPEGLVGKQGTSGENGGHYVPSIAQPNKDDISFSFTPSKSGMPAIDDVIIHLPAGETETTGKDGKDGITPHIGDNGNWFIGEIDTGVRARGKDGKDGTKGEKGDAFTYNDFTADQLAAIKGPQGSPGKTPVRGVDYWTEADKNEIVQYVLEALPDASEVTY